MTAKLIQYMATTRLGERGTMTLPKEYRQALKLAAGAPLTVLRIGDGLILMPEQARFDELCDSIATNLENAGITEASLQATLPEVREQLMGRRYPKLFVSGKRRTTRRKKTSKTKGKRKG